MDTLEKLSTSELYDRLRRCKAKTPMLATAFQWGAAYPWFAIWQSHSLTLETGIIAAVISLPLYAIGGGIEASHKAAKQRERDALSKEVLDRLEKGDEKASYYLYLRPFATSGVLKPDQTNPFEFGEPPDLEERLTDLLINSGPLVCVGEKGRSLGASTRPVADENWQESVLNLVHRANAIFLIPGHQAGTTWEAKQIVALGYLGKTYFLQPEGGARRQFDEVAHWEMTSKVWREELGIKLPAIHPGTFFQLDDGLVPSDTLSWRDVATAAHAPQS